MNNKDKNEVMLNILNNIAYYEQISKILTIEILNTMKNPLKQGDVIKNWNNKCRAIKQKQKAKRRMIRYIKRLRFIYDELNNGRELYCYNLVLKDNL